MKMKGHPICDRDCDLEPSGRTRGEQGKMPRGHECHRDRYQEDATVEEKLLHRLGALSHTLRHSADVKGGQGRILAQLLRLNNTTQRELQQILGIQAGSLSEVLAKLEASGHITRTPNEADRRNVNITLTQEGVKAANEVISSRHEMQETLFQALTEEEKYTLLVLLEKLNADWQQKFPRPEGRRGHGPHHHEVRP